MIPTDKRNPKMLKEMILSKNKKSIKEKIVIESQTTRVMCRRLKLHRVCVGSSLFVIINKVNCYKSIIRISVNNYKYKNIFVG